MFYLTVLLILSAIVCANFLTTFACFLQRISKKNGSNETKYVENKVESLDNCTDF